MATDPYDDILSRARSELNSAELLQLAEELFQHAGRRNGSRNIMELKGLGKTIWKDVDADDYVRQERDSWNG